MKQLSKTTCQTQTPTQLAERIKALETEAALLPVGELRLAVLKEIAQLRCIWRQSCGLNPVA
jgi:hypothetical protein